MFQKQNIVDYMYFFPNYISVNNPFFNSKIYGKCHNFALTHECVQSVSKHAKREREHSFEMGDIFLIIKSSCLSAYGIEFPMQ